MATPTASAAAPSTTTSLPAWQRVLVVVAHPDDESFGLGAVIDAFVQAGAAVSVLCLTVGEASTLGADTADLGTVREHELRSAGTALGVLEVTLRHWPDGALDSVPLTDLVEDVTASIDHVRPDGMLVFDPSGITGHPDHRAATRAAVAAGARQAVPVLAWTLPRQVADRLNADFGAAFYGHPADEVDVDLVVDRTAQRQAVLAHVTQAVAGSVLWTRLTLLGDHEVLRWIEGNPNPPGR
jgi:LmbE family N-acetylglucosaminyl deacetylase